MYKILLAEDEDVLRETYSAILSTLPYDYDVAENGKVALEKCGHTTYDLILLDLMMPVMDGTAFLEWFTHKRMTPTNIIILSNLSSGKELEKALKLGASKSIVKAHYSPAQLRDMITRELETAQEQYSLITAAGNFDK